MKNKLKVLCICAKGLNRSKYLAEYLRRKGYSTKYGGVEEFKESYYKANLIDQKKVDWADIIIVVRKRLIQLSKKKFPKLKKKIIVLDVTDSKRLIPEDKAHLRDLNYVSFQKKWTRPRLREAIKKYLPLKK